MPKAELMCMLLPPLDVTVVLLLTNWPVIWNAALLELSIGIEPVFSSVDDQETELRQRIIRCTPSALLTFHLQKYGVRRHSTNIVLFSMVVCAVLSCNRPCQGYSYNHETQFSYQCNGVYEDLTTRTEFIHGLTRLCRGENFLRLGIKTWKQLLR